MKNFTSYNSLKAIVRLASVLCVLFVGIGNVWGDNVTLTFTSDAGRAAFTPDLPTPSKKNSSSALTTESAYTYSGISITVTTGSSPTTPAIFWKDNTDVSDGNTDLRIYREAKSGTGLSGNTLTISSTYTITALTINGSSLSGLTTSTGTSGGTASAKTWSGSATSITYTNTSTSNIPITSIVVTYTAAASCSINATVEAGSNSSVTSTTATVTCASGISSLGSAGCSIESYGFVLNTTGSPTISDTKHQVGTTYTSTGTSFYKDLTGLTPNTTYYVRPYATNGNGTAYGTQTSFTTLQRYTISYNNNGGSSSMDGSTKDHGVAFALPANAGSMTKTGYHATGWLLGSSSGTHYDLSGSYTTNAAATFYVEWTANTYQVAFNNNGGTGSMSNETGFTYGASKALTACSFTAPAHKYFIGWNTDKDATTALYTDGQSVSNLTTTHNGTVTLYAIWKDHTYTNYRTLCSETYDIVLHDNNGGSHNGSAKVANNGTTLTNIEAPTKNGYSVEGYYTTSGMATKIATDEGALQSDVSTWTDEDGKWVLRDGATFYAKWEPTNYTITYEGLEGASNTNPTSYTIETATIVLANPGSREGYTFAGWTCGGDPITQIVLGTTGNKTITATWSINTPNLAVSAADHVVITATPSSESAIAEGANRNVDYNKTVTLNCAPEDHWNIEWDVYKTGESSTKVAITGSGDGATFTMPDYAVTVSAVMTEAAYKTVCFKNNGEDIDGYASVKVYVGESPVAPTLTDGTSGDACDPTSDKHYGWTKETWTSTIATQSEIDARTGTEAVYGKSAALPVVAAGDPSTITYHAVWAAGSGSPAITPPTPIVYWEKQSLSTGNSYSATSGSGSLSTNVSMTSNSYPYVYTNTGISSAPIITLSGLNLSGASTSTVSISFFTRGSKSSAGPLTVSYYNNSTWTDLATTATVQNGEVAYHEIAGIPKTATSVKLTHSASSGSFSIGTIRIFEANTTEYTFTELDGTNTDGWTNSDWDGYYLITNASTYALDGNGIGEKNFATVSPSDNKIVTTNIGAAFDVTYVSENGYKIQGVGCGDYLNTASNSVAPSASVIYHSSMSYNSVVDNSSNTLKWNSSKFGFYASAGTAIKLYKILASYSTFLTTCCTQYVISGASTSGTAVTGGTLTSTDNSACEDREVKITANVSDGYRFDSWTITAGGSPVARKDGSAEIEDGNPIYVFDMPAADVTVSAAFTRVYTVTYDANGGTGEMIDVNSPYAAGDKVTVLTNTFTKAGYNFDSWSYSPAVSVTDGKFDMPSSDVTITAQWTAKPLNSITITPSSGEVYVGQYVDFTVSYDPADYLSKGYTLNATPVYVTKESAAPANTKLRIKGGRGSGPGASITETVNETVTIKASGDNTKTASVNMTVNPLPRVHFVDIIHNVVFGDVVEEIVGNVLSGAKTTPTHSDVSDPGENYNSCERGHLHLIGWIESTWADAHPGATSGEITGAGSDIYYEAGASINVEVQNGKTFYAVWCIVE